MRLAGVCVIVIVGLGASVACAETLPLASETPSADGGTSLLEGGSPSGEGGTVLPVNDSGIDGGSTIRTDGGCADPAITWGASLGGWSTARGGLVVINAGNITFTVSSGTTLSHSLTSDCRYTITTTLEVPSDPKAAELTFIELSDGNRTKVVDFAFTTHASIGAYVNTNFQVASTLPFGDFSQETQLEITIDPAAGVSFKLPGVESVLVPQTAGIGFANIQIGIVKAGTDTGVGDTSVTFGPIADAPQ